MAEYIICRCEDVWSTEVREAIQAGATNAQEIKMRTRAGMGPCQGRVCRLVVEGMVCSASHGTAEASSSMTVHLPVRPVALGKLFVGFEDES